MEKDLSETVVEGVEEIVFDGNKYSGPLRRIENKLVPHTRFEGEIGTMTYVSSVYKGGFNNGKRDTEMGGLAEITDHQNDMTIRVAFKDDVPFGHIEIISESSSTQYVGNFTYAIKGYKKNDLHPHQFHSEGYGQFLQFVNKNWIYYCGNFRGNMKNGYGILEDYDKGERIIGHWINDKLNGRVSKQYSDGSFFCGEYRKGERAAGGQFLFSNGYNVSLPVKKKSHVEVKTDTNHDMHFLTVLKSHVKHLQSFSSSGGSFVRNKGSRRIHRPKEQPQKYRAIWLSLVDTERLENELLSSVRSFEVPTNVSHLYYAFSRHILPPLKDPNFQYYGEREGEICRLVKMFCHHVNHSYSGRHSERYSVGYIKMDVISFLRFLVSYILEVLQTLLDRKKENSFISQKLPSFRTLQSYLTNEVLRYIHTQCYWVIIKNYQLKYDEKDRNLQRKLRSIYVSLSSYSKYCKYFIYGERMKYYIQNCGGCHLDPIDVDTLKVSHSMNSLLINLQYRPEDDAYHVKKEKKKQQVPEAAAPKTGPPPPAQPKAEWQGPDGLFDHALPKPKGEYEEELEIIDGLNRIYEDKLKRIIENEDGLCLDHKDSIIKSLSNTKFDFKTGFSTLKRGTAEFIPDLKKKLFQYRRRLKCLRISVASDYYLTVLGLGVRVYQKHFGKNPEHKRCELYLGSMIHGFKLLKETAIRFSEEEKSHMPYLCSEQIGALVRLLNGINDSVYALFKHNHEQLTYINRSIRERIESLVHILVLIREFREDYYAHFMKHHHDHHGEDHTHTHTHSHDKEDKEEEESEGEEEVAKKKLSSERKENLKSDSKFGEFLMEIPDSLLRDLARRAKELNLGTHDIKMEKAKVLNKMFQDLGKRFFAHSKENCVAAVNLFDCLYFTFSTIFGMLRYRKFPYDREFILKNVNLQTEAVIKFCDYLSTLEYYKDLGQFFKFIRRSMDLEKETLSSMMKQFKDMDENKRKKKTGKKPLEELTLKKKEQQQQQQQQEGLTKGEEQKKKKKSEIMKSIHQETRKKIIDDEKPSLFDRDVFGGKLERSKTEKTTFNLPKKGTSFNTYTGSNLEEFLVYSDATFLQNRNNNVIQVLSYMKNLRRENLGREERKGLFSGEDEMSDARREDEFDYLFDFSDLLSREFYRFLEQWLSLKIDLEFMQKADELEKHLCGLKDLYNVSDEDIMKKESDEAGAGNTCGILRKVYCDMQLIKKAIRMFKSEDFYPRLKICATSRALDKFISSVLLDIERRELRKANLLLLKSVYRKNEFLDQFQSWNQKLKERHKEELADSISRVITSFIRENIKIGIAFDKTPLCHFALGVRRQFLPTYSIESFLEKKKSADISMFENDEDIVAPYIKSIKILDKLEECVNVFDKLNLLREFEVSVIEEMRDVSKKKPPFEEDDKLPIILYCMMRSKIDHTKEHAFLNDWLFGTFNMMVTRLETFLGYVKNLDVYNKDQAGQFQTVVGSIMTPLKQFLVKKMAFVKETKNRDINLWWLIELLDFVYTKVGFMDKDQVSLRLSSDSALEANQLLLSFLKNHYRDVTIVTSYIGFNVTFDPQEDSVEIVFKMKYSPQIYTNINKRLTKEFKRNISFESI